MTANSVMLVIGLLIPVISLPIVALAGAGRLRFFAEVIANKASA